MSIASQTFGLPARHSFQQGAPFAAIGARLWKRLIESAKARMAAASLARAERELLALAAQYEHSMPSFAAELRAASARR
jgi:hypothetical protein